MSLSSRFEDAGQTLATWLLKSPTVRLRLEAAYWRCGMVPPPIPDAPPKKSEPVIVIGVRPGGAIHAGQRQPCPIRVEAERRED